MFIVIMALMAFISEAFSSVQNADSVPNLPMPVLRVLYVCHDGDLYGAQQSLALIARHIVSAYVVPFVSISREGPLNTLLADMDHVTVLHHPRLQWVKHDPRSWFQMIIDGLTLMWNLLPRTLALYRWIKTYNIDIVHTNSTVSLEGGIAAWLAGVPHVWHVRELFMAESPKFKPILGRWLTRWVIHTLSSQVLCISQAVRNQFEPYLISGKYQVVYNALDISDSYSAPIVEEQSTEQTSGKVFHLGYAGRLSEGKRFHDVLDALANLIHLDIRLVVAGEFVDSAFEQRIWQQIDTHGLADRITFLGFQTDLNAFYASIDALVLPSLNEPFGRVLIEAMRAEVPCIAANSGGIPEIIQNGVTGLLYPPKDTQALAQTLEYALQNPQHLESLRKNAGRQVQERFTMETQIHALRLCYDTLWTGSS